MKVFNRIAIIKFEYFIAYLIMPFIDFQKNPLENIKRADGALLPPTRRSLEMKVHWTQYVTALWAHAITSYPAEGLSPTDYGWSLHGNLLKPIWFKGPTIPDNLFKSGTTNEDMEVEDDNESELEVDGQMSESDGEAWSENSDSEKEDEN